GCRPILIPSHDLSPDSTARGHLSSFPPHHSPSIVSLPIGSALYSSDLLFFLGNAPLAEQGVSPISHPLIRPLPGAHRRDGSGEKGDSLSALLSVGVKLIEATSLPLKVRHSVVRSHLIQVVDFIVLWRWWLKEGFGDDVLR